MQESVAAATVAAADPIDLKTCRPLQREAHLRRVVLNVADVVQVEIQQRDLVPPEATRPLERLGRPMEAFEHYGRALELDPANLAALRSSMEILRARGARAEWESLLRSCLARAPEHPTLVELARMYGISAP